MGLVQRMLIANVVWDLVSAFALVYDGRGAVARMHTDWWGSEDSNIPHSRRALALFLLSLGIMRAHTRAHAAASYGLEILWLLAGVWCGTMTLERTWPSAVLCVLCSSVIHRGATEGLTTVSSVQSTPSRSERACSSSCDASDGQKRRISTL